MAIKAGQILHDVNGFVIDRIQSAGVGNVNIPEEKIYELGNYQTVATVRDIPDLSFDMESFDVTTEVEAILTGVDPTAVVDGDQFDFADVKPIDVISPFKTGGGVFTIVKGIAIPYLNLESATYRFGVGPNATQSFTLRGDGIYYIPGTPKFEEFVNSGPITYNFAQTALEYVEAGDSIYALSICLKDTNSNAYKRLFIGQDYTNTASGFTLLEDLSLTYNRIHVVYGTAAANSYPQTVHENVSTKPAAVRGKDIDVYLSDLASTPTFNRWTGVQSFEITRQVNLENDQEMGNSKNVASDYDTADVTGSIVVKSTDAADLWDKIQQVSDIAANKIVGPYTSVTIPMEVRVSDPDTGLVVKTFYVPDARFTVPGIQGQVQQKLETTFNFTSDGGELLLYAGER